KHAMEHWARLAPLPSEQQKQVGIALRLNVQGGQLHGRGKYAAAERSFREALAICRKVLGEEHPATATSCNNVAFCLAAQGQPGKALPPYEKALRIRRKVLGEEHPDTANSYDSVGCCVNDQGQHGKALPLLEKALTICGKVWGEEHPHTASGY